MATEAVPASATVASTGKGIRYIGSHCFGYSGILNVGDSAVELLSFQSGAGYIVGKVQFYYPEAYTEDYKYSILLNGDVVFAYIAAANSGSDDSSEPDNFINIVIPPQTQVSITAVNNTDTDVRTQGVAFTGEVYGVE